jgi:hypothetical protein
MFKKFLGILGVAFLNFNVSSAEITPLSFVDELPTSFHEQLPKNIKECAEKCKAATGENDSKTFLEAAEILCSEIKQWKNCASCAFVYDDKLLQQQEVAQKLQEYYSSVARYYKKHYRVIKKDYKVGDFVYWGLLGRLFWSLSCSGETNK